MSDQQVQTPTSVERIDRRKSIGRYVKRLSTVLRRGSSSKNIIITEAPKAVATATDPSDKAAAASLVPEDEPIAVTTSAGPSNVPGAYARSAIQQERARVLFAKYGLTLETHEWVTTSGATASVQRVEKPIRMRIHRTCHRCNTTFGTDRVCAKCEHKRCTKCPRYPPKKTKDGAAKLDKEIEMDSGKEDLAARKKKKPLTMKTKTGGEVVYQPARQRIRRICHKCETLFHPPTATICENCQHARCTKCPRDPAKTKKWPDGYPGDVPYEASDDEPLMLRPERTWKRPRLRVRWTCSECSNIFSDGLASCAHCGHERCDKCIRIPPKKQKRAKEYDPEFVRQVEEKIRALTVLHPEPPEAEAAEVPPPAEEPPVAEVLPPST